MPLLRHQEAGNILRVFDGQTQTRHHRHVLYLQFVTVIGTPAVLQVPLVGETLLGVILGPDVLLLEGTVGSRALPGVVNPAHQVVVVGFLAFAAQVRGKRSTHHLLAFADGVARQAPARFKQFLAVFRIAGFLLGQRVGEPGLPDER